MALPDGTVLRLADGQPYMPHHTTLGLLRHIVCHSAKFLHLLEHPDSELYARMETWGPLGEPSESIPLSALIDQTLYAIDEIAGWSRRAADGYGERVVLMHEGPRSLQQMLDLMTYSTAQHGRQLAAILDSLGIEPDGRLKDQDFEGMALPVGVWG